MYRDDSLTSLRNLTNVLFVWSELHEVVKCLYLAEQCNFHEPGRGSHWKMRTAQGRDSFSNDARG